jgi:hypothetical protein
LEHVEWSHRHKKAAGQKKDCPQLLFHHWPDARSVLARGQEMIV